MPTFTAGLGSVWSASGLINLNENKIKLKLVYKISHFPKYAILLWHIITGSTRVTAVSFSEIALSSKKRGLSGDAASF